MVWHRVAIPSNNEFVVKWNSWIIGKVSRHFSHNKDRIQDTTQNVRLRLLSKDFIGRWFFKHLSSELVTKDQAEKMLGKKEGQDNVNLTFIGSLQPVEGHRSSSQSVWKIRDILDFAKFDYERYYYSIQNHTIDTPTILRLLGYPQDQYTALSSLYRQGRLLPSEMTEHACNKKKPCSVCDSDPNKANLKIPDHNCPRRKTCAGCEAGKKELRRRSVSLYHDWSDPSIGDAVRKLRWNDSQLRPFLRDWRRNNRIKSIPDFIVRQKENYGIDAGLLRYAEMVIDNEVVNNFKRMCRNDDVNIRTFNNGQSPTISSSEILAYDSSEESDDADPVMIVRDQNSSRAFQEFETHKDINRLLTLAGISDSEKEFLIESDSDSYTKQISNKKKMSVPKLNKLKSSMIDKIKLHADPLIDIEIRRICSSHSVNFSDLSSDTLFGKVVSARTAVVQFLLKESIDNDSISILTGMDKDRVESAINRIRRLAFNCSGFSRSPLKERLDQKHE